MTFELYCNINEDSIVTKWSGQSKEKPISIKISLHRLVQEIHD